MRVAITNTVALNGGDAAIALCVHDAVSGAVAKAQIEVHEARSDVAARYFPDIRWRPQIGRLLGPRIPSPRWRELSQRQQRRRILAGLTDGDGALARRPWRTAGEQAALADFGGIDAIISTGGTYLVEQYPLLERIFEYEIALRLGVPLIFYTQSLGPFTNPSYRRALRPIFNHARLILLRDQLSATHVRDLGVTGDHLHVVADAAFIKTPRDLVFSSPRRLDQPWEIGVSVRQWPVGASLSHPRVQRYVATMASALSKLARELPARVHMISTCQGISEYWIDDSAVAVAVRDATDHDVRDRVTVDRQFHTPEDFRGMAASFDLFIATRMHAAILALTAGTPVLPIAYEYKTRELFARLGLGDFVSDIDDLTAARLTDRAHEMVQRLDWVCERLTSGVQAERAEARRATDLLRAALDL